MKLAFAFTVWNGLELLNGAIEQIENEVDEIIICWQLFSNRHEKNPEIFNFIQQYKDNPKIKTVEYVPSFSLNTKENERRKHQLMIDVALELDCNYMVMGATDHYYKTSDFKRAKRFVVDNGYDLTLTRMFTYYKQPNWQLDPPEEYYMPFIFKINDQSRVTQRVSYPVLVDPSVRVSGLSKPYLFDLDEIALHHFSMVRVDIDNKFRNAAASIRWNEQQVQTFKDEYLNAKVGNEIKYFQGRKIIEVNHDFELK